MSGRQIRWIRSVGGVRLFTSWRAPAGHLRPAQRPCRLTSSYIGGHQLGDSRKFGNVRAHPKATLVVDDLASVRPWHVRGVEIRGDVETLVDVEPPMPGMSREIIRIRPARIRSWGLASD